MSETKKIISNNKIFTDQKNIERKRRVVRSQVIIFVNLVFIFFFLASSLCL